MPDLHLELGPKIMEVTCECCGELKNRVWGFIAKENAAYAVYYALMNITEDEPRIGLTLSIGNWLDDTAIDERRWIQLEVRVDNENDPPTTPMSILEPDQSNYYPWVRGGKPMTRDEALASPMLDKFWEVADYVVAEDPAIRSYLNGLPIDPQDRRFERVSS